MDALSLIAQTVPAAVLAAALFAVMWPAFERQTKSLQDLIRNNTEAMTKMSDLSAAMCADLDSHDERVQRIEQVVVGTREQVGRIEQKVDKLPELWRGHGPGA